MRIINGFILRNIVDSWVVVPVGKTPVEKTYMLTLTESSALLWSMLEKGAEREELISALCDKYEIDRSIAEKDTDAFLLELKKEDLLDK